MKKNLKMGIGIGGPSILMIFVVLSLTTLGTLALATANADYKFALKAQDNTAKYYAADSKGEEFLSQIDAGLANGKTSTLIPISDVQDLSIQVRIPGINGKNYDILRWNAVTKNNWDYTDFETEFQDQLPE